ncbi:uncharacterized protein J3R85_008404 [Psidium guajava]|nr:uncharacterized protein J3R85_008404 [Psidium guajava]
MGLDPPRTPLLFAWLGSSAIEGVGATLCSRRCSAMERFPVKLGRLSWNADCFLSNLGRQGPIRLVAEAFCAKKAKTPKQRRKIATLELPSPMKKTGQNRRKMGSLFG